MQAYLTSGNIFEENIFQQGVVENWGCQGV